MAQNLFPLQTQDSFQSFSARKMNWNWIWDERTWAHFPILPCTSCSLGQILALSVLSYLGQALSHLLCIHEVLSTKGTPTTHELPVTDGYKLSVWLGIPTLIVFASIFHLLRNLANRPKLEVSKRKIKWRSPFSKCLLSRSKILKKLSTVGAGKLLLKPNVSTVLT